MFRIPLLPKPISLVAIHLYGNSALLRAYSKVNNDTPSFSRFLKDLTTNRNKTKGIMNFFEEYNVVLLMKFPPKLDYPNSFSISISIGSLVLIMLCSIRHRKGILKDVPVFVGNLLFPYDFVVMDMPEDTHVPIILGRPWLATTEAVIDVKIGKLTLEVGEEKMVFELQKPMRSASTKKYQLVNELKECLYAMFDACLRVMEEVHGFFVAW
ncbi:uncharacterized protein LOC130824933 [Amaranthus tricolor]|uniref:uncharacterized protein LOC130824933 n=1 Tax=Amaranthus tricolor TaxID=29722 RepID=UPI00258700C1|nr:uncharacterized protein LOC130824933 [Amaranthus tricolor]